MFDGARLTWPAFGIRAKMTSTSTGERVRYVTEHPAFRKRLPVHIRACMNSLHDPKMRDPLQGRNDRSGHATHQSFQALLLSQELWEASAAMHRRWSRIA